jgi:hypothetical protein
VRFRAPLHRTPFAFWQVQSTGDELYGLTSVKQVGRIAAAACSTDPRGASAELCSPGHDNVTACQMRRAATSLVPTCFTDSFAQSVQSLTISFTCHYRGFPCVRGSRRTTSEFVALSHPERNFIPEGSDIQGHRTPTAYSGSQCSSAFGAICSQLGMSLSPSGRLVH